VVVKLNEATGVSCEVSGSVREEWEREREGEGDRLSGGVRERYMLQRV
jgi:hypothetical protein